jgi:enamine deaminase RidA (YjgF/YER057c/UK114 family)
LKGFAVKTTSLVGLAGALVIAFFASQAAAQEGKCPRVDAEENVKALGIEYYPPAKTVGNFVPAVTVGKVMYLAGNGPKMPNGKFVAGKLGSRPGQLSVEQGYQASRFAAISLLSAIKAELGDLNRVKRIVKVLGMVNSDPAFTEQPRVINGASDLLVQVFGDCGKHARSAVGCLGADFRYCGRDRDDSRASLGKCHLHADLPHLLG